MTRITATAAATSATATAASAQRVFLITGTSSGFGRHYVEHVLAQGDCVVATTRDLSKLPTFTGSDHLDRFLALPLDVSNPREIDAVFDAAVAKFGHVDVVVNNAGYGLAGPFETLSDAQCRQQMEINFFSVVNITRKAIQVMRESKRGGVIQQCSSSAGQIGYPGFAFYCASKHAVDGFTESIAQEMHPNWNIHLTLLTIGGFKTDWWTEGHLTFGKENLEVYQHLNVPAFIKQHKAKAPGDPLKAVQKMYDLAIMDKPPKRVVLGSDVHADIERKNKEHAIERKKWEHITLSTDVDQ